MLKNLQIAGVLNFLFIFIKNAKLESFVYKLLEIHFKTEQKGFLVLFSSRRSRFCSEFLRKNRELF